MAERKSILRKLKEMVPGTNAYSESQTGEQAIQDRSLAAQADYEERTGEVVPQEQGLEPDQVLNTLMELPLSGPMSIVNVGKSLSRMAVGSGVRDAVKKADPDVDTNMRKRFYAMNEKELKAKGYGPGDFDKFKKDQILAEKILDAEAINKARELRQSPGTGNLKEVDVSSSYSPTKESRRMIEDNRRIETPKKVADMATQKAPSPVSKSTDLVVKEVSFPKTEKLSVQQQKLINDRLKRLERK